MYVKGFDHTGVGNPPTEFLGNIICDITLPISSGSFQIISCRKLQRVTTLTCKRMVMITHEPPSSQDKSCTKHVCVCSSRESVCVCMCLGEGGGGENGRFNIFLYFFVICKLHRLVDTLM